VDDAIRMLREQRIPLYRGLKGFVGFTCLADRQTGYVLGISFWETEADRDASERLASESRQAIAHAAGSRDSMVRESWEVALNE
jgi:heme-degrading monooxygenase HmoA